MEWMNGMNEWKNGRIGEEDDRHFPSSLNIGKRLKEKRKNPLEQLCLGLSLNVKRSSKNKLQLAKTTKEEANWKQTLSFASLKFAQKLVSADVDGRNPQFWAAKPIRKKTIEEAK